MAVNKVEINGEVKLDLTQDTVTPETLLKGSTAHNAAGDQIDGAVTVAPASTTTPKAPGTASAGSESAYARGDHVHPKQPGHDNDMLWGGKNLIASVSPVDAAIDLSIGGNKAAFSNPNGITIEYTNDGGATWLDYGATDLEKIRLVTYQSNKGFFIGKKTSSTCLTRNDMLRISVNAVVCGFYTDLKKILVFLNTYVNRLLRVRIEKATISQPEVFIEIGTYEVAGWSGWNSIPVSLLFGRSPNQIHNVSTL